MEHMDNQITLRGNLLALPYLSHENHGKKFFRFTLEVPRLSGTVDLLPVVAEEKILNALDLSGGEMLRIEGQIRSHNQRESGIRRLLIFVFAQRIQAEDGANMRWQSGEPERNWSLNDILVHIIPPSQGTSSKS